MLRFAPQHFGTGPGRAWIEQQQAEERKAAQLSREVGAILNSPGHGKDSIESLFWRLAEAALEMAKRIETLESKAKEQDDRIMALLNPGKL